MIHKTYGESTGEPPNFQGIAPKYNIPSTSSVMAPELKMLLELLFSFAQQYSAWYTKNIKNLQ